jgi:hypothetical protein
MVGSLSSELSLADGDNDPVEPTQADSLDPAPGPDAFAPPGFSQSHRVAAPADTPPRAARSHAPPVDEDPILELDTGSRGSNDEFRRPPATVGGAAALNITMIGATSSASGLAVAGHANGDPHGVRCSRHGLFYDTRKASGCTKCLEPGRKLGAAMALKATSFKLIEIESPVKRAFFGLAIALAMGFIPAAYHALGVGSRELRRLRAEQEIVSRRPATQEIVQRFEELDLTVETTKSRYTRNTGIIRVMVTGGAILGWYRLT